MNDRRPLAGIRVLGLTHRFSGPFCTTLLAELGAEITKVEGPRGDPSAAKLVVEGRSATYTMLNRGARVVRLDLKTMAGLAAFDRELARTDVFVTNLRPRALHRLELDPKSVRARHPDVVYCSLSAAGWLPEDDDVGLDDGATQATTGCMWATGWPGSDPTLAPIPVAATANAIFAAIGVVSAIHARLRSQTSSLDIAMVDALAACLEFPLMATASTGRAPERNGGRHPTATPSQLFRTGDGLLAIMAVSNDEFARLGRALGASGWESDERFSTIQRRFANRDALIALIEAALASDAADTWFERLGKAGVACAPVHTLPQAIDAAITRERGLVEQHDSVSVVRIPGRAGEGHAASASPLPPATRVISSPRALLEGVRVVDLTRYLAGPFATTILSDLGATVTKVEPLDGDPARWFGPLPDDKSGYFASVNRGKSSVALDLKSADGKSTLRRLLAGADLLIDNFRPGVMTRLGFSDDELERINPELVAVSISGFGDTGAYASRAAYDMTIQAFAGLMDQTGSPAFGPTRLGFSLGDIGAGLFAALACVGSLVSAKRGQRARRVDIAMLDSLLAFLSPLVTAQGVGRPRPGGLGAHHAEGAPLGAFRAADGFVYLAAATDSAFAILAAELERPQWLGDVRFATAEERTFHRAALIAEIEAVLASRNVADTVTRLARAGLLAVPVRTLESAVSSSLFARRALLRPVVGRERLRIVRSPVCVHGASFTDELAAPPELDDLPTQDRGRNEPDREFHPVSSLAADQRPPS